MITRLLLWFFRGLRFPWLFTVTLIVFIADLLVPDFLPFVDELLLGLATLLLGAWRVKKTESRRLSASAEPSSASGGAK